MYFTLNHVPSLFVATALTFGGMIPIFNAEYAIREMGIPQRIAKSKEAQTIMIPGMGRTTTIGLALWTFYLQGKFEVVDTLMFLLGSYIGAIDAYVCPKESVPDKAGLRGLSGLAIATYGWLGMTTWA
ncbi:Nn.00g048270.m01.CDS01 [Neocucurbitaria sp. VM-36]